MYAIRVDASRHILNIELSGRLTTAEALRAVSQAFALAEASSLRGAICDTRELRRGPGGLLLVAAAIAFGTQPGMRIAFLSRAPQEALLERLIRYSGSPTGLQVVETLAEADAYVEPVFRRNGPHFGSTELRHAEELLVAHTTAQKQRKVRLRVSGSASGIPAA